MKKNNKSRIDVYSTIYPVDIVVANQYTTLKELQNKYIRCDDVELPEAVMEDLASTTRCRDKKTGKAVVLIKFNRHTSVKGVDKQVSLVNTCAHEAAHAVLSIYDFIEEDVCLVHQETFAYFMGSVTEWIYKTIKNK